MPRANFAGHLPIDVKLELDKRIRECCYSQPGSHAAWLISIGHKTSRSSVSRYAQALMKADKQERLGCELAASRGDANHHLTRREQILIEVGTMRIKELELLSELRDLVG